MARINMAQIVMALALAAVLLLGTTADEHTVGSNTGWTSTLPNATFYSNWASSTRFEVGDELVFNFGTGAHDVAKVTKDAYDNCITSNTISLNRTGPATVPLNATGEQYFICTFPGHCAAGQKLAVNVVDDNNNTSPTSPPTTGTTPTPPPPPPSGSSASSRGIASAFVLMSLAIAFFC